MEGDSTNIMCPVCTLYLRAGITLETHLLSHPKQKVIEALIAQLPQQSVDKLNNHSEQHPQQQQHAAVEMPVFSPSMNVNSNMPQPAPNQSFIYQQFMSSSGTQPIINVNPMNQQFVAVPTLFNPMICPPYIFQQQQQVQILSGSTSMHNMMPRQSTDMFQSSNPAICASSTTIVSNPMDSSVQITDASQKFGVTASSTQLSTISEKKFKIENVRIIERAREPNSESVVVVNNFSATDNNSPEPIEDKLSQPVENNCASSIVYFDPKDSGIVIEEVVNYETIDGEKAVMHHDQEKRPVVIQEVEERTGFVPHEEESIALMHSEEKRPMVSNDEEVPEETEQVVWQNKIVNGASKACQTTQLVIDGKESVEMEKSTEIDLTADENDMYEEEMPSPARNDSISPQEANEIIALPINPELHASNVIVEVDGINIIHELMQNRQTIISKVHDYVCMNETTDDNVPQIMMNLNEEANDDTPIIMNMDEGKFILGINEEDAKAYSPEAKLDEESMSRESLNIRADERMPPRGELSEQESNGASEVGWGSRMYQECSSGMSTSYDLLARESWDASDCSDTEVPPLQSRIPPVESYKSDVDDPDEVVDQKTLNFTCATCGATFRCPKERRVHQTKEHGSPSTSNNAKKIFRKRQSRSPLPHVAKEEKTNEVIIKHEPELETQEELNPDDPVAKTETIFIEMKENVLCNTCGEFLPSLRELTIHNKKVHKIRTTNQIHRCKICSETFRTEAKYAEHLKIHPLECNICGKNFYKMANLQLHLKRHMGVRPYKCDICSKAFLTKQKLGEHHNVHTGNAPIKCNLCNETFRRHSNLIQHRNRHHLNVKKKLKDFVCPCGEVFHSKNKFNWHKEIHEAKPKSCRYCYEKFIHMASLTRHIRRAHNQRYVPDMTRDNENVECTICKGVYLKSSLEAHLYTHTGKKQHSCPICNKEFTTKWNLKLHKWTHAAPTTKPFRCETCQAAFIRQSDYTSHMNSHRSIRPYTCNYCGCKFIRKYNCLRHVREHEEGKSFTCEICNKSFHRSYYLKEHMRVHSGIRPFSCHICGKTSATKSNHNKHMKIHHAREPVSTEG